MLTESVNKTITVLVRFADGRPERVVKAPVGWTLMEALREADIREIEAICGGCLACSTCHVVVVDGQGSRKIAPPSADEEDMLDFAQNVQAGSRLSCQIEITTALDGLTLIIPS